MALGCFTGDALQGQPCENDEECNAVPNVLGERLVCTNNVCGYAAECGNGIVDNDEECDSGTLNIEAGYSEAGAGQCSTFCTALPYCGDGIRNGPEICDDGNQNENDGCLSTCSDPECGDGIISDGEKCDDGLLNVTGEYNAANEPACSSSCKQASYCGDGVIDGFYEECDNGEDNHDEGTCTSNCKDSFCGDGLVGPGEACDNGEDNGNNGEECTTNCSLVTCGDGVVQGGEECDDGNIDIHDECANCLNHKCGDKIVYPEEEECDDGNNINDDGCSNECKYALCGDGIKHDAEECDDGNAYNNDSCTGCKNAYCGDGTTYNLGGGEEECDDGNNEDNDGCSHDCKIEFCGDGVVNPPGEECDDGNLDDEDLCSAECKQREIAQISTGGAHTCILLDSGIVKCWGLNNFGQLGINSTKNIGDDETPQSSEVATLGGTPVTQIATGQHHTCALVDDSTHVLCWGRNDSGQLGLGHTNAIGDDEDLDGIDAFDIGGEVVKLSSAGDHTCALMSDAAVRCWGNNASGQLGLDHTDNIGDDEPISPTEIEISGLEFISKIEAGYNHTCAIKSATEVYCWGSNNYGEVGSPGPQNIQVPNLVEPAPPPPPMNEISLGENFGCAYNNFVPFVHCWGLNNKGQLGKSHTINVHNPMFGPFSGFSPANQSGQIASGGAHTCVTRLSGQFVYCWGLNESGQLGLEHANNIGDDEMGDSEPSLTIGNVVQIAAGGRHTCAILDDNTVRCWGRSEYGQLGYGNTENIGDEEGEMPPPAVSIFP